jgi:2-dehydro-3-deoxyphosphogluconate aldolase / (4S)-4-hydroxy-2-oxoglutarate aldolase
MTKQEVLDRIAEMGVVPVVRAPSPEDALRAIDAICEGGVTVLEITMTVPGAIGVIEAAVANRGQDVIVGAGTVLDAETARACIAAGAQFIVSPALDISTIESCAASSVAVMPGALTPTEVVTAWRAGADVVKIFPCGSVGGASYIKALKAPLPQIPLMPTGGVSIATAGDFIKAGAFALGVGSDLVDIEAIARGNAKLVTERARVYLHLVREARAGRPANLR